EDFGLDLRRCLVRAGMGPAGARRQGRVAAFLEPLDQLVDPPAGDAVSAAKLSRAAMLQDNCIDDVASQNRHPPPPSLVARTMSCDIRELCGPDSSGERTNGERHMIAPSRRCDEAQKV